MLVVEVLLVVGVLAAAVVVATGRGGSMAPAPPDLADGGLPEDRPVTAADLPRLRFRTGLRGYRMDEVDLALGRLGDALADREAELARLRAPAGQLPAGNPAVHGAAASAAGFATGGTVGDRLEPADPAVGSELAAGGEHDR